MRLSTSLITLVLIVSSLGGVAQTTPATDELRGTFQDGTYQPADTKDLLNYADQVNEMEVFWAQQDLESLLNRNEDAYEVARNLADYLTMLPEEVAQKLGNLGKNGHWLDSGCGKGVASIDFLSYKDFASFSNHYERGLLKGVPLLGVPPKQEIQMTTARLKSALKQLPAERPRVTCLSYTIGASLPKFGGKLRSIEHRLVENVPVEDIAADGFGRADLLTEVLGPMAYGKNPAAILRSYANFLKPDGVAYVVLGWDSNKKPGAGMFKSWVKSSSNYVPFFKWLETLKGINVEFVKSPATPEGNFVVAKITRTQQSLVIEDLQLRYTDARITKDLPPVRVFHSSGK